MAPRALAAVPANPIPSRPDRCPPDPNSPETVTETVRTSQRLVADAQNEPATARARVRELEIEVARLSLVVAAKEANLRDLCGALEQEKCRRTRWRTSCGGR